MKLAATLALAAWLASIAVCTALAMVHIYSA